MPFGFHHPWMPPQDATIYRKCVGPIMILITLCNSRMDRDYSIPDERSMLRDVFFSDPADDGGCENGLVVIPVRTTPLCDR